MGGWRGRGTLGCALLAIVVLGAAGCGVEEHANNPRPTPSARVSVVVTDTSVSVQPKQIGVGPEPASQIPQNRDISQPRTHSGRPLDVVMVAANLTDKGAKLVVRGPGTRVTSGPLIANGNASLEASLKAGTYTISAAGIPGAKPTRLSSATSAPRRRTTCFCPSRAPGRLAVGGLAPPLGDLAGVGARSIELPDLSGVLRKLAGEVEDTGDVPPELSAAPGHPDQFVVALERRLQVSAMLVDLVEHRDQVLGGVLQRHRHLLGLLAAAHVVRHLCDESERQAELRGRDHVDAVTLGELLDREVRQDPQRLIGALDRDIEEDDRGPLLGQLRVVPLGEFLGPRSELAAIGRASFAVLSVEGLVDPGEILVESEFRVDDDVGVAGP